MALTPGAAAATLPAGSHPRRRRSPRAAIRGGDAPPVEKAASSTFSSCPAVRRPAGLVARFRRRGCGGRGLVFREAQPRKAVVAAPA